jgi:hypothetical protein
LHGGEHLGGRWGGSEGEGSDAGSNSDNSEGNGISFSHYVYGNLNNYYKQIHAT